jgi:hypothetical protein
MGRRKVLVGVGKSLKEMEGLPINQWEEEKPRKGVGKSRKEMYGLLTNGKKKSPGKELEKVERKW